MRMSFTTLAAAALLGSLGIAQAQNSAPLPSTGDHGVEGAIKPATPSEMRTPSTTGAAPSSPSRETGPNAAHRSGGANDRPTSDLPGAGDSRGANPTAK
jgi:hypothetical protein